jgi:hypothetical protein
MWTPEAEAVASLVGPGTLALVAATGAQFVMAGGRRGIMAHAAGAQHVDYEQLAAKVIAVLAMRDNADHGGRRAQLDNFVDAVVLAGNLNQDRERVRVGIDRGKWALILLSAVAAILVVVANLDATAARDPVAFLGLTWMIAVIWFVIEVRPVAHLIWEHGWPSAGAEGTRPLGQQEVKAVPQSDVVRQAEASQQSPSNESG